MFMTAQTRKEQAIEAIRAMVERGETVCTMRFGESGGELTVSADKTRVMAFDVVEVDGTMYFLGFGKHRAE
jgi:hypothetical protein